MHRLQPDEDMPPSATKLYAFILDRVETGQAIPTSSEMLAYMGRTYEPALLTREVRGRLIRTVAPGKVRKYVYKLPQRNK